MLLSKNLSLREATKSATAIRKGIDNEPSIEVIDNLQSIARYVFQPLRDFFRVPIGISSGYRSYELNDAIGGSRRSQHITGQALDIDADIYGKVSNRQIFDGKVSNRQIFDYIKDNLEFDQLIWEFGDDNNPAWVHVSYKKDSENRMEVLKAVKERNLTFYKPFA